jgi:hypothetical protein
MRRERRLICLARGSNDALPIEDVGLARTSDLRITRNPLTGYLVLNRSITRARRVGVHRQRRGPPVAGDSIGRRRRRPRVSRELTADQHRAGPGLLMVVREPTVVPPQTDAGGTALAPYPTPDARRTGRLFRSTERVVDTPDVRRDASTGR